MVVTQHYFILERGTRLDDPISAYLFILVLEILFILAEFNKNIHGIKIFKHEYLYSICWSRKTNIEGGIA